MKAQVSQPLSPPAIALLRLANQRITAGPSESPSDIVSALGAMQAQDLHGALWAIGVRLPGTTIVDVERALAGASIVRTWVLRGTLHLVASEDVRRLLGLLAPRVIAAGASRRRQLEIDEPTLARSRDLFAAALAGGRLATRKETMRLLEGAGIDTGGQRGIHILRHLSLEGLLCQAALQGGQPTFALLDDWVPETGPQSSMSRDEAVAELMRRYFSGHGPATLRDFVWWSGMTVADARAGLESTRGALVGAKIGDVEYFMAADPPAPLRVSPAVHLLPGFDEYILGYRDRGLVMDASAAARIVPGGNGLFRPAIVLDGRAVGTWRLGTRARSAAVTELFEPLDTAANDALAVALLEHDAFVGRP